MSTSLQVVNCLILRASLRANLDLPGPQSLLVPLHVLQLEQFMIRSNIRHCVEYSTSLDYNFPFAISCNFLDTGGYDHVIFIVSRGTVGAERLTRCMWWSKIQKASQKQKNVTTVTANTGSIKQ